MSIGKCWVQEVTFTAGRRYLSLYLRLPPEPGFPNGLPRTVAVARVFIGRETVTARIWTDHPDPVVSALGPEMAHLAVRPVAKDRTRCSVSVTAETAAEGDAIARALVYIVQTDLLSSRGAVPTERVGRTKGVSVWTKAVRRRGRR
jgi:hypothetical protein